MVIIKIKRINTKSVTVYRLGKRDYVEQPKFTYISQYVLDEGTNTTIAIVKRVNFLPHILVMVAVITVLVLITKSKPLDHLITYSDMILAEDGILELNIANDAGNTASISVNIIYRGSYIIDTVELEPGESVSGVDAGIIRNMQPGYYKCKLEYTINSKYIPDKREFDITLMVQ